MTDAPGRIRFSYWSDPLCIWAFIAQDKLDRLVERHERELEIAYHVVPVFGSLRHRFAEGAWCEVGVEGRVRQTAEIAARFGHPEVSGACWRDACDASSWAPGAAIEAVGLGEASGELPPGSTGRYQLALRRAFFVDDRNVARRKEQLAVAEACGLPRAPIEISLDDGCALAALWEDHQERERLGIQGSPTYVFDHGRAMLYGNVSEGVITATVEELLSGTTPGRSECA